MSAWSPEALAESMMGMSATEPASRRTRNSGGARSFGLGRMRRCDRQFVEPNNGHGHVHIVAQRRQQPDSGSTLFSILAPLRARMPYQWRSVFSVHRPSQSCCGPSCGNTARHPARKRFAQSHSHSAEKEKPDPDHRHGCRACHRYGVRSSPNIRHAFRGGLAPKGCSRVGPALKASTARKLSGFRL